MKCPKCKNTRHVKDGFTGARSQRYRCTNCGCRFTPEKKVHGYPAKMRELAIRMYADGLNFRQIGRHLKISHTTVMEWVKAHADKLPEAPVPEEADNVEMDELYTFIEKKKTGSTS